MSIPKWQRRFVSFVEASQTTEKFLHLSVKVPRDMARAIERDCADHGEHSMVYYADAFAAGLSGRLTTAEVKSIS